MPLGGGPTTTAMILAAGRGTRLRSYTTTTAKPFLDIGGQPLIVRTLHWLARQGFRRVVINLYRHAAASRTILDRIAPDIPELTIVPVVEPELLGTGGGIRHALKHWHSDAAWIINGDVVCNVDLFDLARRLPADTDAALVVRPNARARRLGPIYLGSGRQPAMRPVQGILRRGYTAKVAYQFTGIHYLRAPLAAQLPTPGCVIRDGYCRWLGNANLYGYVHRGRWYEIGTPARLAYVRRAWRTGRLPWLARPGE